MQRDSAVHRRRKELTLHRFILLFALIFPGLLPGTPLHAQSPSNAPVGQPAPDSLIQPDPLTGGPIMAVPETYQIQPEPTPWPAMQPPPAGGPIDYDDPTIPQVTPPKQWFKPGTADWKATWLAGDGDDIGITSIEASATIAIRSLPQLALTVGHGVHFFNGPAVSDLPPRLFDTYVEFGWNQPILPNLMMQMAIAPGLYGDYEHLNSETVRVTGRVLGFWTHSERTTFVLGFLYLDRKDVAALPAGGVIWKPHPDVKYELTFPRPKIARRVFCCGEYERWVYLAGEFGGNSWAIERDDGSDDVATYRDYRLLLGAETLLKGGMNSRVELGYIFSRELEYESATPDVEPTDTVLIRCGFTF